MDETLALQEFLYSHAGQFCDGCLAIRMGMPRDDVKIAIFADPRAFARVSGFCSACRKPAAVTALRLVA